MAGEEEIIKEAEAEYKASGTAEQIQDAFADLPNFGESEAFEEMEKGAKAMGIDGGGEQLQQGISNLLYLVVNKGIPAKDVLQMPDEMVETLYSHAYNMYNQGKYEEAHHLFRFLMLLDPTDPKYAFGQAAVSHMQKDYEKAAKLYYMVSLMDITDPMPHYHASDCYLQLKDLGSALLALEFAIDASADNPKYAALVQKATALKGALEEKLGMSGEETGTPTPREEKVKKKEKLRRAKLKAKRERLKKKKEG